MLHHLQIRGNSMLPTFTDGQIVSITEVPSNYKIQRFDVVLFKLDDKDWQIKRVVGLPSEKVSFLNGKVLINEQILDEASYLPNNNQTYKYKFANTQQKVSVAKEQKNPTIFQEPILENGEYYLLGDNRINSIDSRDFGAVNLKFIKFLV